MGSSSAVHEYCVIMNSLGWMGVSHYTLPKQLKLSPSSSDSALPIYLNDRSVESTQAELIELRVAEIVIPDRSSTDNSLTKLNWQQPSKATEQTCLPTTITRDRSKGKRLMSYNSWVCSCSSPVSKFASLLVQQSDSFQLCGVVPIIHISTNSVWIARCNSMVRCSMSLFGIPTGPGVIAKSSCSCREHAWASDMVQDGHLSIQ